MRSSPPSALRPSPAGMESPQVPRLRAAPPVSPAPRGEPLSSSSLASGSRRKPVKEGIATEPSTGVQQQQQHGAASTASMFSFAQPPSARLSPGFAAHAAGTGVSGSDLPMTPPSHLHVPSVPAGFESGGARSGAGVGGGTAMRGSALSTPATSPGWHRLDEVTSTGTPRSVSDGARTPVSGKSRPRGTRVSEGVSRSHPGSTT